MVAKISKRYVSHRDGPIQPNFMQVMINMIVMGEYRLLLYWRSTKKLKKYGALKLLLTQDHMGLEISKRYSSYSFHPNVSQTLWGHWLPWWNTGFYFSLSLKF